MSNSKTLTMEAKIFVTEAKTFISEIADIKTFISDIKLLFDRKAPFEKNMHTIKKIATCVAIIVGIVLLIGGFKIFEILANIILIIFLAIICLVPIAWIVYEFLKQRENALISGRKLNATIWLSSKIIEEVLLNPLVVYMFTPMIFIIIAYYCLDKFLRYNDIGAFVISIIVLIGVLFAGFMRYFFETQTKKFQSFFSEVESYDSLKPVDSLGIDVSIEDILQESENLRKRTEALIHKRRYAWFVFDTPSYRSYKQMIHDRIREMIPFLEQQKGLLAERIREQQEILVHTQNQIQQVIAPVESLQYTAQVQNERLDKQIEGFEALQKVVVGK